MPSSLDSFVYDEEEQQPKEVHQSNSHENNDQRQQQNAGRADGSAGHGLVSLRGLNDILLDMDDHIDSFGSSSADNSMAEAVQKCLEDNQKIKAEQTVLSSRMLNYERSLEAGLNGARADVNQLKAETLENFLKYGDKFDEKLKDGHVALTQRVDLFIQSTRDTGKEVQDQQQEAIEALERKGDETKRQLEGELDSLGARMDRIENRYSQVAPKPVVFIMDNCWTSKLPPGLKLGQTNNKVLKLEGPLPYNSYKSAHTKLPYPVLMAASSTTANNKQRCIFYSELKIVEIASNGLVCFGLSSGKEPVATFTGNDKAWVGNFPEKPSYSVCSGILWVAGRPEEGFGPAFVAGDVVGCLLEEFSDVGQNGDNSGNYRVRFTKNGQPYARVLNVPSADAPFYPTVSLNGLGTTVEINFGGNGNNTPFLFDVNQIC